MSPTRILEQTRQTIHNSFYPNVPKKLRSRFCFGIKAFTLQTSYVSLNANARQAVAQPATAHSEVYRLTHTPRVSDICQRIIANLGMVTANSLVNVDFSEWYGFGVLGLGLQTGRGRAVPIKIAVRYSHNHGFKQTHSKYQPRQFRYAQTASGDQFEFTMLKLKQLKASLGYLPRLVFDREFGNQRLIEFLTSQKVIFYVRLPARRIVNLMALSNCRLSLNQVITELGIISNICA